MNDLERFVKNHRSEFDAAEPDEGHFARFEARLAEGEKVRRLTVNRPAVLRIAALILLLIGVSVFLFEYAGRLVKEQFSKPGMTAELPVEIQEAVQYYNNQAEMRLDTLNVLVASHKGDSTASNTAKAELRSLDASTNELKQLLAANPGNEKILDAILRNQQMKESVLNNIVDKVSHSK